MARRYASWLKVPGFESRGILRLSIGLVFMIAVVTELIIQERHVLDPRETTRETDTSQSE